ncbi:hypothetical protein ACFU53_13300 [Streptomyces sp. NPDC057474]|uniref:hypothetical protein n=1 Tax=Streptomyces sp. NPDC057474 TaxID=3346144 RepID=UPI00369369AC
MERIGEIFEVSHDIEGSDVGYRWFERERLTPGHPFGWNLSYTTFDFSDRSVTTHESDVPVDITVTNTGARAGAAMAQAYVSRSTHDGSDAADFVPRLVAFSRVHLEPGERRSTDSASQFGLPLGAGRHRSAKRPSTAGVSRLL